MRVGEGIPEYRQVYETGLREGGILIGVEAETKEDIENLERLLDDVGGAYALNSGEQLKMRRACGDFVTGPVSC